MTTNTEKAKERREYYIQIEKLCHLYAGYTEKYQLCLLSEANYTYYKKRTLYEQEQKQEQKQEQELNDTTNELLSNEILKKLLEENIKLKKENKKIAQLEEEIKK